MADTLPCYRVRFAHCITYQQLDINTPAILNIHLNWFIIETQEDISGEREEKKEMKGQSKSYSKTTVNIGLTYWLNNSEYRQECGNIRYFSAL